MKQILYILSLSLLILNITIAQDGFLPSTSAERVALGGSIATSTGIQGVINNQAGLAKLSGLAVILNTEQRFLISDIIVASIGVGYNLNDFGTVALTLSNLGYDDFREQKIGLAYARKLTNKFSIGGQLDMLQNRIAGFGSTSSITFEVGTLVDWNDDLTFGFHLYSPGNVILTNGDEVPTRLAIGIQYNISEKAFVVGEFQKILDQNYSIRGGINYELIDNFYIRAGGSSNPVRLSFGLAYGFGGNIRFDAAMTNHETLGITPAASLTYQQ